MGVNSLPKTVTRQRRACDFWTQALLRMSPSWVRFLVYNTGLVQYRWTGLDLLIVDRLKLQDWKIVNFSKYSLSCYTYFFQRCRFVLVFSVLAYSILRYFRFPYLRFQSPLWEGRPAVVLWIGHRLNHCIDASSSLTASDRPNASIFTVFLRPYNHRVHFWPLVFPSEATPVALRCFYPDDESIYISLIASPFSVSYRLMRLAIHGMLYL